MDFGKIAVIFALIIMLYYVPEIISTGQNEQLTYCYVEKETDEFMEAVKNSGKITEKVYTDYMSALAKSGVIFDVQITHRHKTMVPIYNDDEEFTGDYEEVYYDTFQKEIVEAIYHDDGYYMTKGDYLSILVSNKTKTLFTKVASIFLPGLNEKSIVITMGGKIRNEI